MLAIIDVKHFPEMDVENLKHSRKYFHILIYFMVAFIKKIFIDKILRFIERTELHKFQIE